MLQGYASANRFLRYKYAFGQVSLLIIAILMPFKFGVEVEFDVEFFVFLGINISVQIHVSDFTFNKVYN